MSYIPLNWTPAGAQSSTIRFANGYKICDRVEDFRAALESYIADYREYHATIGRDETDSKPSGRLPKSGLKLVRKIKDKHHTKAWPPLLTQRPLQISQQLLSIFEGVTVKISRWADVVHEIYAFEHDRSRADTRGNPESVLFSVEAIDQVRAEPPSSASERRNADFSVEDIATR